MDNLLGLEYLFTHQGNEFYYCGQGNRYLIRLQFGDRGVWKALVGHSKIPGIDDETLEDLRKEVK